MLLAALHRAFGLGDGLLTFGSPNLVAALLNTDAGLRAVIERDLQRLYAQALHLVETHRIAIIAVADALVAKRVLTGDEVKTIINASEIHGGGDVQS